MTTAISKGKSFHYEVDIDELRVWIAPDFYELTDLKNTASYSFERLWEVIHPEDRGRVREVYAKSIQTGDPISLEYRIIGVEGKAVYVRNESVLQKGPDGRPNKISGHVYDVSQYVKYRHRMHEMQELLEMKDQSIAMIAHDLRNPVSQVDGILKLIAMDLPEGEARDLLLMAQDSIQHAYDILSELNAATRNKVEGQKISKEKIAILPLLERVAEAFKIRLESKNLKLSFDADESLLINLNEHKMFRAIENLVSNAIKFSPNGKSIDLRAWEEPESFCISVEDAGIGMPEDIRKRLFDGINKDIRRSGTKGESSIGIGLSIVKGVVDLHQGKIKVESEEGEGSKFTICLPK